MVNGHLCCKVHADCVCSRISACFKETAKKSRFFYQSSCIDSISKDTGCFIPSSIACLEPCLSSALQRMFPDVNIQRLNTIFGFLGCGWHLSISKCVFAFQTGGALN